MTDPLDISHVANGTPAKAEEQSENTALMDLVLETREPMVSDWTQKGIITICIFFGALILWSIFAPLSTGAVVTGRVIVSGDRDVIEHLEGGIIKKVHVKNGTRVKAGDLLVEIDPKPAEARLRDVQTRIFALNARLERLRNEWNLEEKLDLSALKPQGVSATAQREILSLEASQFKIRQELFRTQEATLKANIKDLEDISASLGEQVTKTTAQLKLIEEEIADVNDLLQKGLAPKTRSLALRRQREALLADELSLQSQLVEQKNRVQSANVELQNFRTTTRGEIAQQMQDTQVEMQSIFGALDLAQNQKDRTSIRADKNGIVMNMQVKARGEVLQPGDALFDLVPEGSELVVDARLSASDAANIVPGLPAKVTIAAFKGRNAPIIEGTVRRVSPDTLLDEQSGLSYYSVQISFNSESLAGLSETSRLQPGFPVQAIIETDSQPVLGYLLSPILTTVRNAFTEQ
ncbi:HlyD family type I secretion periplasmic adaptor subunit [Kordiimonas sp. SCSIO 12610]|uniref:HlyD family type I secretion periplasmic adaptor subunit n=1 Tax=Kordiimonas sp. SCSIO 12610 TaxID=2829597 RepID=UPI00210DFF2F|nr:HlyD family type I secretion periplasmic adaptor subunit [Kordiimonas sp. SCSIO 12610]UTW55854.1 HlyD family type I secretion periplasmic adaptor subunit [Kordiimonas sp. SCSIO 12610]